jgi:hypothetical protein
MEQNNWQCRNCGHSNASTAKFCSNCGINLAQPPTSNPIAQPSSIVQCPNCGGYKTTDHDKPEDPNAKLWIFLSGFFTWGLGWLLFLLPKKKSPLDGSHRYSCQLCGYNWIWKPGTPPPPINVQPDLIAKGAQKIEEDEKRRRDAEYWEEQQKKRDEKK